MKHIIFFILIFTLSGTAQINVPLSFHLRANAPGKNNFLERTWSAQINIRPVYKKGNLFAMAGFSYNRQFSGRFDLTTRSVTGGNYHFGIATFYKTKGGLYTGIFARRFAAFVTDLPPGKENQVIESIFEQYKIDNPGTRAHYYNHYGFGFLYFSRFLKAEFLANIPVKIPYIQVIPHLRTAETPVSVLFALLEFKLPYSTILKTEWQIHTARGRWENLSIKNGTGSAYLRKFFKPGGSLAAEIGYIRESGPTGFYRSSAAFAGIRIEK